MVLKTISIINEKGSTKSRDGTGETTTWKISNQTALDSLLRRYKVDTLLDDYHCDVFDFRALTEGRTYSLGETTASQTFELTETTWSSSSLARRKRNSDRQQEE